MEFLGDSPARNNSKGCGAVMRMAPAGLFVASIGRRVDADAAFELGTDLTAITHGHPTGALAGGAFAVLILELARGATLAEALTTAQKSLVERPHYEETRCWRWSQPDCSPIRESTILTGPRDLVHGR